jgi:hypothetical protein
VVADQCFFVTALRVVVLELSETGCIFIDTPPLELNRTDKYSLNAAVGIEQSPMKAVP